MGIFALVYPILALSRRSVTNPEHGGPSSFHIRDVYITLWGSGVPILVEHRIESAEAYDLATAWLRNDHSYQSALLRISVSDDDQSSIHLPEAPRGLEPLSSIGSFDPFGPVDLFPPPPMPPPAPLFDVPPIPGFFPPPPPPPHSPSDLSWFEMLGMPGGGGSGSGSGRDAGGRRDG